MKKEELKTITKNALNLNSKAEAYEFYKELDAVIEALANELAEGERAKLGDYITIENKRMTGRKGELNGYEFNTPSYNKLVVKGTVALKELKK